VHRSTRSTVFMMNVRRVGRAERDA
jgi:hypothetical protein